MFTPPPSPMPFPAPAGGESSPPALTLTTPHNEPGYPFPRVPSPPAKAPCTPEPSPSWNPLDVKKRSGRRILFLVALLPAAFILSAALRHLIRLPAPVVLDEPNLFDKRQLITTDAATPTSSLPQSSSSSLSQSTAPSSTTSLPTIPNPAILPTPFPQPFDASLSDNFTTIGCQAFFSNFTQDTSFRQCRSFSFLLNSSAAFLGAQRNLTLINAIIWGTCNTPPTAQSCDATMASYLSQLNSVCKSDLNAENPVVLQAQIGFQSYTAMRTAACLTDPTNNAFCYIDALAATTPADLYFYGLPLGTPVPNTTKPSCSPCVKSVLAVYAQYVTPSSGSGAIQIGAETGNSTTSPTTPSPLPVLGKTYPAAARLAVNQCGGTYASVGVAQPSRAERHRIAWGCVLLSLILACFAL
ncbi:hypothetical protein JB92DRAFT_1357671 [Gautieria morchelliformis]|nr:hypothetical protein JB92DRAFT_1357671 [Gautieria morchelliformis]